MAHVTVLTSFICFSWIVSNSCDSARLFLILFIGSVGFFFVVVVLFLESAHPLVPIIFNAD